MLVVLVSCAKIPQSYLESAKNAKLLSKKKKERQVHSMVVPQWSSSDAGVC